MAVTAANVRKLEGAIGRPVQAGGAATMGDAMYIAADDDWEIADANVSAAIAAARGILVEVPFKTPGGTTCADGDPIHVVTFGPVGGFSGLTPGGLLYLSNTAGQVTHTAPTGAGTWTSPIGYAESATVVFVNPGIAAPVSNS